MIEICAMDSLGNPVGIDKFPECVPSSNFWYLHGQLEADVGFDLALFTSNNKELLYDYFTIKEDNKIIKRKGFYYLPEGIYDVKVIGFNKPCKGYFWTQFFNSHETHFQRGLVVYADDKEANNYAYERFQEKSKIL